MPESSGEVTLLLAELKHGNKLAMTKLVPLVYEEMRRLAGHYMRGERMGHTLQPTALVNEAYLALVGQDRANWQNRAQFIGVAAQCMRRILVDYSRARSAAKRGAGAVRVDADSLISGVSAERIEEVLAVDQALERLSALDPQQCQVVELRYFAGLTVAETAEALGISERTVKREWAMGAAWLRMQLSGEEIHDS